MTAYNRLVASGVVQNEPCIVHSIVIYSDGVGLARVRLYDGLDASSGRNITPLMARVGFVAQYRFDGLYCARGLYVDFEENVEECTVEYEVAGVIT